MLCVTSSTASVITQRHYVQGLVILLVVLVAQLALWIPPVGNIAWLIHLPPLSLVRVPFACMLFMHTTSATLTFVQQKTVIHPPSP